MKISNLRILMEIFKFRILPFWVKIFRQEADIPTIFRQLKI